MVHYYITGASKGLGKALAELLLEDENSQVIGIARTSSIQHPRYSHVSLDLADLSAVSQFTFGAHPEAEKIVLINNAGTLGNIQNTGKLVEADFIFSFNVNLISPAILCNKFIASYDSQAAEKLIVNVTSGAGKRAISGWSSYCASKAGLDILSEVIQLEQHTHASYPVKVLAVAPGIVDTSMQETIRNADIEAFPRLEEFQAYKEEGALATPLEIANKFRYIIQNPDNFESVVISVRDLE